MNENKDNKQELLKVGLELFAKKGFDGTSTQEIVDAAGVTKPTMYHYFASKEGLLREILGVHYRELLRELRVASSICEDIPLSCFRLMRVYFDSAVRTPDFFRLRAGIMHRSGEDALYTAAEEFIVTEREILLGFFEAAAMQAGNLRGKESLCALSFEGIINAHIATYLHSGDESFLSDETVYRLRQQFLYGIYS